MTRGQKIGLIALGAALLVPALLTAGSGSGAVALLSYLGQKGLPRGMKNNNPGNIRVGNAAWQGKIPLGQNTDRAFEQFTTYVYGIRAMIKNLLSYYRDGLNTVERIIYRWAPPADHNDTSAYVSTVCSRGGFSPSGRINLTDRDTMRRLVIAMTYVENARDAVTPEQFNYAWGLAGLSGVCGCGCSAHVGAIYPAVPSVYACNDGTYSTSSGSRACSRHGGRKSDQPLTLQAGGSGLLNIQDVPLSAIHVDTKLFQGRENEFSERSVMNIVNDVAAGSFVWENLDPITLWRSPEGKLYLLSGHSRNEAFKRLAAAGYKVDGKGFERIPSKIYQGATADTAKRIALESNTLSTKETDIERAAYYRKLRQNGVDEKTLLAAIKKNEARNWTNIYAYTFLSPTGRTWAALQQLGEGEDTSATLAKSLARWIGQARRGWPALTNEHEAELYAWLFDRRGYGTGSGQVSSEREFLEKVSLFIQKNTFFGAFDASKPLNILGAMQKSPAEAEHDAQIAQRQKQIIETERIIRDEIKRLTAAKATKADLQRIVAPYETSLRNLRADLQRLILKKSEVVEYSKREAQLFGIRRAAVRIA